MLSFKATFILKISGTELMIIFTITYFYKVLVYNYATNHVSHNYVYYPNVLQIGLLTLCLAIRSTNPVSYN